MKLDYQIDHGFSFSKRKTLDFRIHAQGELEVGFLTAGSCRFTCGNAEYDLSAGDVFIAFPNQPHAYSDSRDVEAYLLIVPVKAYLPAYYNTLMKKVPDHSVLRSGQWDTSLLTLLEYAFNDMPTASSTVMQGYLMVIFGKLLESMKLHEQHTGAEEALRRLLIFLSDNYREHLTRADIAKALGYNESYISHLFSETMHISLPEYIHTLQIDDACRMLRETDIPVSQLAEELGFASIRNFNRVFLDRTGMTPRQFRDATRK